MKFHGWGDYSQMCSTQRASSAPCVGQAPTAAARAKAAADRKKATAARAKATVRPPVGTKAAAPARSVPTMHTRRGSA
jgi:hypothetical protein